jgi:hypothetical protein
VTDEQLQKLIDHKVQEATAPLERRWESLRGIFERLSVDSVDKMVRATCLQTLGMMDELEKITEPRRKLPTDPRRKNKLDK